MEISTHKPSPSGTPQYSIGTGTWRSKLSPRCVNSCETLQIFQIASRNPNLRPDSAPCPPWSWLCHRPSVPGDSSNATSSARLRRSCAAPAAPTLIPPRSASVRAPGNTHSCSQRGRPPMMRLITASSTACWQLPSAESTCTRNIDNVSVGGNTRSRCGGSSSLTPSSSCSLVNRLKNA